MAIDVGVGVLLVLGVGLQLLSVLGLLAMRDTYSRLHYVGPAGFGLVCIAGAIFVQESFSFIGDRAVLVGVLSLLLAPVLIHVIARTARVRLQGDWTIQESENVERVDR
jgi:monovalent cation/proton antiporter MnhG/PhaG subunit